VDRNGLATKTDHDRLKFSKYLLKIESWESSARWKHDQLALLMWFLFFFLLYQPYATNFEFENQFFVGITNSLCTSRAGKRRARTLSAAQRVEDCEMVKKIKKIVCLEWVTFYSVNNALLAGRRAEQTTTLLLCLLFVLCWLAQWLNVKYNRFVICIGCEE